MKKWAWSLGLVALTLASSPALANKGKWFLDSWSDNGGSATCTYTKAGKAPIVVKANKISSSNPYSACATAHGTVTSKRKLVSVPGARFNPAENDDD